MPNFYFPKATNLTDATPVDAGWKYLTPDQLSLIPGVSLVLAQQQAIPDVRDSLFSRIETRTSDPGSPVNGRMWLRTDL